MVSKHEQVMLAIKARLEAAAAAAGGDTRVVRGEEPPERVPDGGHYLLRDGDKGEPEETLGVGDGVIYTWFPEIEVEVRVQAGADNRDARLDAALRGIETQLQADISLGGLVDHLDWRPSEVDEERIAGAETIEGRSLVLLPEYDTDTPLG